MLVRLLKTVIPTDHFLLRVARRLRVEFGVHTLRDYLWATFYGQRRVFFVQVGSNDGVHGDPLHELIRLHSHWRGVFVEPVPYLFERLKSHYAIRPTLHFENVAISGQEGTRPFYYVAPEAKRALGEELPYWFEQLGSFDRSHIVKHLDGRLDPFILMATVPCRTLNAVIEKYAPSAVDLVHIDTEGYDYEVLQTFDIAKHRPLAVLMEHAHLSQADQLASLELFREYGYRICQKDGDTLAFAGFFRWLLMSLREGSGRH